MPLTNQSADIADAPTIYHYKEPNAAQVVSLLRKAEAHLHDSPGFEKLIQAKELSFLKSLSDQKYKAEMMRQILQTHHLALQMLYDPAGSFANYPHERIQEIDALLRVSGQSAKETWAEFVEESMRNILERQKYEVKLGLRQATDFDEQSLNHLLAINFKFVVSDSLNIEDLEGMEFEDFLPPAQAHPTHVGRVVSNPELLR